MKTKPNVADDKLEAWLKTQAKKLKALKTQSKSLKLSFVRNAKLQGEVLAAVRERLGSTTLFDNWLKANTDIGHSTALLWIDVAQNFDAIQSEFADSNPLEWTVRSIRDAIRDHRQAEGKGKPGSGKPKPVEHHERWEDLAATAERDAEHNVSHAENSDAGNADTGNANARTADAVKCYKIEIGVSTEADHFAIQNALSHWSPFITQSQGKRQDRNVVGTVMPKDVGTLFHRLGTALDGQHPSGLKVTIQ